MKNSITSLLLGSNNDDLYGQIFKSTNVSSYTISVRHIHTINMKRGKVTKKILSHKLDYYLLQYGERESDEVIKIRNLVAKKAHYTAYTS